MSLHRLAIDSAASYPDALAVAGPDGALTYREVDLAADALAGYLASVGVDRGDRVVVWTDKTTSAVVAFQAVLRVGAAYVPIDGSTPVHRVATIVRDCRPRAICAPDRQASALRRVIGSTTPFVDPGTRRSTNSRVAPVEADPDDLAYILYTSGSTGAPKGVCLTHRNALAFVDWAVRELDARPEDRFSNHAPLTFDLSVLDLYAAFAVGGSVHLVPSEMAYAPEQLVRFLHDREITVWYSVPSALVLMMRDGGLLDVPPPSGLRAVLFAGEPFPIAYLRHLRGWTDARLLNLYGPTETNVCTFHEPVPADFERDRPVPIGTASSGDTVWAVTDDGRVAAPGEEGELVVEGPTVMLGYWGREPHRGAYRTGDLVRVLDEGVFDYLGRRDHMVKVRGHRVELGEVEAVLQSHPGVDEVAVTVEGEGTEARLEAFLVPAVEPPPGLVALKRHCAQRLPRYMIVDAVRHVAALPRTATGKVDRRALVAGLETVATR